MDREGLDCQALAPRAPRLKCSIVLLMWFGSMMRTIFSFNAIQFQSGHRRRLLSSRRIHSFASFESPSSQLFVETTKGDFEPEGLTSSSLLSSSSKEIDLSFLPDYGESLPPLTKHAVEKATENYVYGSMEIQLSQKDIATAVEEEYKTFDVPIVVGDTRIDVSQSGEEADESFVNVLSLAAIHKLPKEITLELLNLQPNSTTTDGYRAAVSAFSDEGWAAVSFPNGHALFPKTMSLRRPRWLRKRKLVRLAHQDVAMAGRTDAPKQRLLTREEFLDLMATTLSETAAPSTKRKPDHLLFFPKQRAALERLSLRRVFRKLKRTADKQAAKLKSQGRAGVVAYAYFNFFFYTIGILWQWPRVSPADPFSNNSALLICFRKLGRVFGSLYIVSNILKLPKLVAAVAMAPMANKVLERTKKRLNVGDNYASALLVSGLFVLWSAIIAVPFFSEYARLRRFVFLDRVMNGYVVQPV